MTFKNIVLFISLFQIITIHTAFAQTTTGFNYKKYTWEANPRLHAVTDKEKEGNFIILKEKILIEYAYETSGELVEYLTRHTIVHINNEKGIEEMNKVYIPYSNVLEEMDLKARTINSAGKIIPVSKSAIKKVDNLENAGPYLIFAMEGVDVGSEIEYIYTNKGNANVYGSWTMQNETVKKEVNIDIYSPKNLVFEAKGYNGFPQFGVDTSMKDKHHIYAAVSYIDALFREKYSTYDANKMRFDYQLTHNYANGNARLYSWEYIGSNLYNSSFNFEKSETKAIEKLILKLGLGKLPADELKIKTLEQYVKTNTNIAGENSSVDKLLELKYGDKFAFHRLYIGVAKALNIPFETVLTTDRTEVKFDQAFPSLNGIKEYLIYYPGLDKYLSPSDFLSRLGFPPADLTNNKGLFIKETSLGDIKTGITKIKNIEPLPYTLTQNDIQANVSFQSEAFIPTIDYKHSFSGYSAYYIQPTLFFMEENQKKELLNTLNDFIGKESIIKSSKYTGGDQADIFVKPFAVEGVLEAPHLIESAGNKYLFKAGALIGRQEELYQEKARQADGEISYTHSFTRNLEIKIPKGFKVKNPEEIRIDKKYQQGGKTMASFISEYTLENDLLKIKVYEDYRAIVYPKADFEQLRQVINAAADFNKVVLIFEKL